MKLVYNNQLMTTNNKLVVTLILGLFALSMAQFTPYPSICPAKQFYEATSQICLSCASAPDTICGVPEHTCSSFWYDSAAAVCKDCTSIQNSDVSKLSVALTQCACKDQYYWQAEINTCVGCDANSDEASCNSCNNIFDGTICKSCSSFTNTNGQYDAVNKGCFCKVGYVWESATYSCVLCSTSTTPDQCKARSCPSFFWNVLTTTCIQCSSVDFTDPAINNRVYGKETCACFQGFGWDANSNTCMKCTDASSPETCSSPSCSLYIWAGTACTNDCTTIQNSDTNFPAPVNGACRCLRDYFWNSAQSKCTDCAGTTADNCKLCPSYVFSAETCSKCSDVVNTDTLYNAYANNGKCFCNQNYFWDMGTNTCLGCETAPPNICGSTSCSNFYGRTALDGSITCETCYTIPNTMPKLANTPPYSCACGSGYIWVQSSYSCIFCDITNGYIVIDPIAGTCSNCNTVTNAKKYANYSGHKDKNCGCAANYTLLNGTCSCDVSKKHVDFGKSKGCGPCNLIPGASNFSTKSTKDGVKTTTTGVCSCIVNATWDPINFYCYCNDKTKYMSLLGKGCLNCPSGPSTGQVDPTNPYRCVCSDEFIWSTTSHTCVCLDPNSIILSDNSCFSCLDPLAASNGSRLNSTACGCPKNYIWNTSTRTCICDSESLLIGGVCIGCSSIPSGTKKKGATQCGCASGYFWNFVTQTCDCLKPLKCVCPTNTVSNPTGVTCTSCSVIPGSTGASAKVGCACLPGFTWNPTLFKCVCASHLVSDGFKYCTPCNVAINAVSQLSSTSCNCIFNHVWDRITGRCEFVNTKFFTKNIIMKPSGEFISCEGLGGSIGLSADNFNCRCEDGFVWNDITSNCIECSKVPNNGGALSNGYSCKCAANFMWDVLSFSCILNICSVGTDTKCGNCALVLNSPTAKLMNIGSKDTFVSLSNDWYFTFKISMNGTNTVYNKLNTYRCACPPGTSWNRSRKRCYPSATNGFY